MSSVIGTERVVSGEKVGHSVSPPSSKGEITIGETVFDTELEVGLKVGYTVASFLSSGEEATAGEAVIKEVGLTVSTSDCVGGGIDKEGAVKVDDFVMHSSLLT